MDRAWGVCVVLVPLDGMNLSNSRSHVDAAEEGNPVYHVCPGPSVV